MKSASETFSDKSHEYASARPHYPSVLFQWLAQQCKRRDVAWDCATGNGQAAVGLSPFFKKINATDISEEQILHSMKRENIKYSVQRAEQTDFVDHSFDLITVAQALHWFDYSKFWPEVSRIACNDAIFCAWGYDWLDTTQKINDALVIPFREIIDPFWAPNNKILWNGYRDEDIAFPFQRIETPLFSIELEWSFEHLVTYMMTWSAFKRSRSNPDASSAMDELIKSTRRLSLATRVIPIHMALKMVAGRVRL